MATNITIKIPSASDFQFKAFKDGVNALPYSFREGVSIGSTTITTGGHTFVADSSIVAVVCPLHGPDQCLAAIAAIAADTLGASIEAPESFPEDFKPGLLRAQEVLGCSSTVVYDSDDDVDSADIVLIGAAPTAQIAEAYLGTFGAYEGYEGAALEIGHVADSLGGAHEAVRAAYKGLEAQLKSMDLGGVDPGRYTAVTTLARSVSTGGAVTYPNTSDADVTTIRWSKDVLNHLEKAQDSVAKAGAVVVGEFIAGHGGMFAYTNVTHTAKSKSIQVYDSEVNEWLANPSDALKAAAVNATNTRLTLTVLAKVRKLTGKVSRLTSAFAIVK